MSDARALVLGRVRAALADVPAGEPERYDIAPAPQERGDVALFCTRASDYRATVTQTEDPAAAVRDAFARHGARHVLVPDGFPDAWCPTDVNAVHDDALDGTALDALDGVLTTCALAIAETGTIVLDGGPGQGPRALTLVPDLHVCIVRCDQIVGHLPGALAALASRTSPITFVSGPSATSDIELERVEGVHGPRRLELVVV
jgi:L-lactate dehydrogenase complex protein LldG